MKVLISFFDMYLVFPVPLIEKGVFPLLYILISFVIKLIDHKCIGLLLGFLFYSIDLCICFCASTMMF